MSTAPLPTKNSLESEQSSLVEVCAEFAVELSVDEAWRKLSDLSKADRYVPGLTSLEFSTEQREGVGTSRRVEQGKSLVLDETVIRWEEGCGYSLRLHRGSRGPIPPLQEHFFDYGLQQRGNSVYLHNRMRYRVGLGLLGVCLDKLVLRKVMLSQLRDVTLAQKLYYESGQPVSAGQLKAAKASLGA